MIECSQQTEHGEMFAIMTVRECAPTNESLSTFQIRKGGCHVEEEDDEDDRPRGDEQTHGRTDGRTHARTDAELKVSKGRPGET